MKEDSTLFSVSPEAYAEYLEQLSDTAFWHHAHEKAHMPYSTYPSQALSKVAAQPDDTLTCLTCELRTTHCNIPLTSVREILPASQRITLLPDVPFWMPGILSWRNETLAAIDLCSYLTRSSSSPLQKHVILVVQHEGLSLALCVLSIASSMTVINTRLLTPATGTGDDGTSMRIVGLWEQKDTEQEKIFMLDIAALFKDVVQLIERKTRHE